MNRSCRLTFICPRNREEAVPLFRVQIRGRTTPRVLEEQLSAGVTGESAPVAGNCDATPLQSDNAPVTVGWNRGGSGR